MVIPNIGRVIVRRLRQEADDQAPILIPGQLKAGENLYYGEVVNGGDTRFKAGDHVYYSEYSASTLIDVGAVRRKKLTLGTAMTEENVFYVIADDDIMAYDGPDEVPPVQKPGKSK